MATKGLKGDEEVLKGDWVVLKGNEKVRVKKGDEEVLKSYGYALKDDEVAIHGDGETLNGDVLQGDWEALEERGGKKGWWGGGNGWLRGIEGQRNTLKGNEGKINIYINFKMKISLCILLRCKTYCYRKWIVPVNDDEVALMRDVKVQRNGDKCDVKMWRVGAKLKSDGEVLESM